jgi:PIN domain nuclease of toxin-antitoxin system
MIVLDTHVLVWLAEGLPRLGPEARAAADATLAEEALAVSAITFWEVAMLQAKDRLRLTQPVEAWRAELLDRGLTEIAVTGDLAITSTRLVGFHADPADRIIATTAWLKHATLLTADERILAWNGPVQCLDART